VFGPHSLAQLRAWQPGLEQRGVFASLRVWRAGEQETTHAVLLSVVLDAERERKGTPAPASSPAVAPDDTGDGEKAEEPCYTGVNYNEDGKGWQARLMVAGKQVNLGMFNTA
jgi:hypothetical protein